MPHTKEQIAASLARGNELRMEAVTWRMRVRTMPRVEALASLIGVLERREDFVMGMSLWRFLKTVKRLREEQVRRIVIQLDCLTADRRLRQLSDRQLEILVLEIKRIAGIPT